MNREDLSDREIAVLAANRDIFDVDAGPSLTEQALEFARRSMSANTLRAYTASLRVFNAWCVVGGYDPLECTPKHIANFISDQASGTLSLWTPHDRKNGAMGGVLSDGKPVTSSTINTRLAAIRWFYHQQKAISPTDSPVVSDTFAGIKNMLGTRPKKKTPVTNEIMMDIVDQIGSGLVGERDKAMLLLAFAGAFRRSELVALKRSDCSIGLQGVDVLIASSKGDQAGEGEAKPILRVGGEYCPVAALERWLKVAEVRSGPLFRRIWKSGKIGDAHMTGQSVADLVKKYARKLGYDDLEFSGHSMRRGFNTSAADSGASISEIQGVSLQKDVKTVAGYIDHSNRYDNHPARDLLRR